jgi:hypothetical protein
MMKRTTCSLRECTVKADVLPVRSISSLPWYWPYPPIHLTLSFDRFTGYHELFLVLSTLQDCRNDSSGAISTLLFHSYLCTTWVTRRCCHHPFLFLDAHLSSINRFFF